MFVPASLDEALRLLGDLLAERGFKYEIVAIGGAGLQLLGAIDRPTKDLDVVALLAGTMLRPADTLPRPFVAAIEDVARVLGLPRTWINAEPAGLLRLGLPDAFVSRLEKREYGGLTVALASRYDQIHFKLYAAADGAPGGKHHRDLQALSPTVEELRSAARWARSHDPSAGFARIVADVLDSFGVEDG